MESLVTTTQPACPLGSKAVPCKGVLGRLSDPDRYVCTACGRVFSPQDVAAIVRGRMRAAAGGAA